MKTMLLLMMVCLVALFSQRNEQAADPSVAVWEEVIVRYLALGPAGQLVAER